MPERYSLRAHLGEGAQGRVVLAWDTLLEREVVVKALRPGQSGPLARREQAALFALDLPGVVRLLDVGELSLDGVRVPMLVMEHVIGEPFPGMGRCSWAALAGPLVALLRVLRRVHAAGVVHRDLKPAHVRVRGGDVVLLDFGAVCGPGADAAGPSEDGGAGDYHYMAPEQIQDPEAVSAQADLFAVGVMVYEALAGVPPHPSRGDRFRAQHTPLEQLRPELPPALCALVSALLSARPCERPESAEAALRALGQGAETELETHLRHWRDQVPDSDALTRLFRGPERIYGRRSRARAALQRRSLPSGYDMALELSAWVGAGRARWDHGALELSPADLAWLEEDTPLRTPPSRPALSPPLSPALERLHQLLHLAWPGADEPLLSRVWAGPEPLRSALQALADAGCASCLPDGRWRALNLPRSWGSLGPQDRSALHEGWADALRPGDTARLRHLLAAGRLPEAIQEAALSAEQRAIAGDIPGALRRVDLGLSYARGVKESTQELVLLRLRTWISLSDSSHVQTRRSRYELLRSAVPQDQTRSCLTLLEAAERARSGWVDEALGTLALIPPDPDERLDRWRLGLAVEATQQHPERQEQVLSAAEAWAQSRGSQTARADVQGWRGMKLYRQGDSAQAERLLAESGEHKGTVTGRLSVLGTRVAALIELRRFDEALTLARGLHQEAWAAQAPVYVTIAEWAMRCVAWRRGEALGPDWELIEASEVLDRDIRRAQLLLGEACFAWRMKLSVDAAKLATLAASIWGESNPASALVARALAAVNTPDSLTQRLELAEQAARGLDKGLPALALQALTLLMLSDVQIWARYEAVAWAAARALSLPRRAGVRELLDLSETFPITDR